MAEIQATLNILRIKRSARADDAVWPRALELIVMSYARTGCCLNASANIRNVNFAGKTALRENIMSYVPNHPYMGQYYFNPQWIQIAGENSPSSLVYGNMVNFSVGPDGTHYFHQMFSGPFYAPTTQTVQSVDTVC